MGTLCLRPARGTLVAVWAWVALARASVVPPRSAKLAFAPHVLVLIDAPLAGWFKFGGVEFFKITAAGMLGDEGAWNNKTVIYLGAAACAEFIADIFLCPLEATRIRCVSDPTFASGLVSGFLRLIKEEGPMKGFYSGFGPILCKQVPYTMAKFAVQGAAADSC